MTLLRRLTTILCASVVAMPLVGQTTPMAPAQRATPPVTAETDRDLDDPQALRLSLNGALSTAMRNNLGVELQSYDYQMAGFGLRSQYGIFDWFGTATAQESSARGATISRAEPTEQTATRLNLGVSQNLPAGGEYFIGLNNNRLTTVGGFTDISPAYRPSLVFQARQPLMRNFGVDVTRRGILIARNTLGISQEQFRTVLMTTAVNVEQAYLDLVYARRSVEVVKESLFLALDQARITQIRIDVGASAPLDILQPRVQIATTEEQLIVAVARVRDAEDRLRALLNLPRQQWDNPIIPTDAVEYTPMNVDMEAAVTRALELRPELRQAALVSDTREVQYLFARNQARPRLDFNVSYSAAGVAGRALVDIDPVTGTPVFETTPYSTALRQVFGNDFPSWTFGLNLDLPFTNIGARAEARRAELDLERSRTDQEQSRQVVMLNVRAAVRDIDTAARTIVASRTAREAAERNLEAERRRYENGMTTNFQVLQIQQQLSDARVRELQSLIGYRQAVANYHRQVGDILDVRGIAIEEPELPREPRVFTSFDRLGWLNYGGDVRD
ncbi:MAG TPA: TolC family protein [Thermoanaerobaculia bacterium]|nr:TolC family protein [Thermoanaerobaculia bacterium]